MDPAHPSPVETHRTPSDDRTVPPATGDPAIDAALAGLDDALTRPLPEHIAAGEDLDRVLRGRLDDLGST